MAAAAPAQFETFTRKAGQVDLRPLVTLQRRGVLTLNRAAYEAMGSPQAAELLFDRANRVIGIRPINPDAAHAYPLRKQPDSSTYVITAKSFTKAYAIPRDVTRRWEAAVRDGMLTIELEPRGRR